MYYMPVGLFWLCSPDLCFILVQLAQHSLSEHPGCARFSVGCYGEYKAMRAMELVFKIITPDGRESASYTFATWSAETVLVT